ncbi:MAG: response regulator [Gemmatimonadota bacterium]
MTGTKDSPRRVLLIDDSADILEAHALLLEVHGYEVRTARDGRSAMEVAPAFRPHAVLLDLGLPDQSGFDVFDRLRALPDLAETVFVAFSGRADPDDRTRSLEAGFHEHLVKPASLAAIKAALG